MMCVNTSTQRSLPPEGWFFTFYHLRQCLCYPVLRIPGKLAHKLPDSHLPFPS